MENPPAFPFPAERNSWGDGIREGSDGMTLRDWFAGQALAGLCANRGIIDTGNRGENIWAVAVANEIADAMLAARAGDA